MTDICICECIHLFPCGAEVPEHYAPKWVNQQPYRKLQRDHVGVQHSEEINVKDRAIQVILKSGIINSSVRTGNHTVQLHSIIFW